MEILRQTKKTPLNVSRLVARAGGFNPLGEPNFRVVWGWNRLAWVGGTWDDRDSEGYLIRQVREARELPRYPDVNRWHVEKWMGPESYGTPESWREMATETEDGESYLVSPYPDRGDYEHCFTIQNAQGEFLDLTPGVVELVIRAIVCSRYLVHKDKWKAMAALRERHYRADKAWEARADDIMDDAFDAFHGAHFVTVPATETVAV